MAYSPRPLQDLARSVFREHRREDHVALVSLQRQWAALVGPGLAERSWPARLQRGLLWVTAPDSSWAYQLQFLKRELLGSLQAGLPGCPVTDLRFKVGTIPAPPLPAATPNVEPAPEPEAVSGLARAASSISDPALRSAFVRAMSKQMARRLPKS
ncbi:MAG: DciA family protein [SAR324 cluster bacterium]